MTTPDPAEDLAVDTGTRTVMHAADIARALTRISHEILESNRGASELVLLGIPTRGVALAERVGALLADFSGESVPVGALDVAQVDQLQRALRALSDIGQELTQLPTRGVALEICKLCPQSHNGSAAGSDRLSDPMGAALRLEAAQVQNGLFN